MKSNKPQHIHTSRGYDREPTSSSDRIASSDRNRVMSRNSLNSPNSPTTSSKTGANSASQQNLHLQRNISLRTSSLQSLPETQLCAKSHAFSGAVLNPKQARELTPRIVLSITHTLGNYALENANAYSSHGPNSHSAESNSSYNKSNDGHSSSSANINSNEHESKVQYTVWITEAWRCLGWAEPSAALFWEMATMYHTLHVAARSIEVEETEVEEGDGIDAGTDGNGPQFGMIQRTLSQSIPPILSCGSSASMDSVEIKKKERTKEEKSSPTRGGSNPSSSSPRKGSASGGNNNEKQKNSSQSNKASAASAKELPVWLVGMYLLLHCEEGVFRRNVSGEDSQRFDALIMAKQGAPPGVGGIWKDGKGVDFGMLLMQPNLSLRAHLHGGWMDNSHFTIYILRNLRKFLLLSAVPHNADAQIALASLIESESTQHDKEYTDRQNPSSSRSSNGSSLINVYGHMDADEMLRCHDEEHGDIGLQVHLTTDDLERLNFILQAPSGGLIDDPPMYISDLMTAEVFAVYGSISLEDAEREIRQQLELELLNGAEDKSQQLDEDNDIDKTAKDVSKMELNEKSKETGDEEKDKGRAEISLTHCHKELNYSKVRGKTILLKPNTESRLQKPSPNNEHKNDEGSNNHTSQSLCTNGRLHDVFVAECSDAHIYLLQPFEHATISACSNCTIVVGSVAGLLHVVDCEKMTITSAARRILVSNCNDVSHYIFTPSPPLLVGINRNCQFAPYNTYYGGLREDLLATGLAGAVVSADNVVIGDSINGPALQCASNKWKQPVELNKICDVLKMHAMPKYADDKASNEDTMQTPTLVPASEFQVLFVPYESAMNQQRRLQQEANNDDVTMQSEESNDGPRIGSVYCHCLADVLQLSPFRLPTEYERRAQVKADRIKSLQQLIETDLTPEQQSKLEEELNRGFRDWLVTSGNLRQVLDLVHLESQVNS